VIVFHLICFFILFGNTYAFDIVKRNDSFYDNIMTYNAANSGAIFLKNNNNMVEFSNGELFNGLQKHSYINIHYNKYRFFLLFNRIDDIPNTSNMWQDNGDGFPSISEINYHTLSYFSYKKIFLEISKIYKNFIYTIKLSNSSLLSDKSYGIGFNLSFSSNLFEEIEYKIKIHDLLSLNRWSTDELEVYIPTSEISIQKKVFSSLLGMGVFIDENNIDYKIGLDLMLMENFSLSLGSSQIYDLTTGFKFDKPAFSLSYAYMIPNKDIPFGQSQQFSVYIYFGSIISKKGIGLRP